RGRAGGAGIQTQRQEPHQADRAQVEKAVGHEVRDRDQVRDRQQRDQVPGSEEGGARRPAAKTPDQAQQGGQRQSREEHGRLEGRLRNRRLVDRRQPPRIEEQRQLEPEDAQHGGGGQERTAAGVGLGGAGL